MSKEDSPEGWKVRNSWQTHRLTGNQKWLYHFSMWSTRVSPFLTAPKLPARRWPLSPATIGEVRAGDLWPKTGSFRTGKKALLYKSLWPTRTHANPSKEQCQGKKETEPLPGFLRPVVLPIFPVHFPGTW